MARRSINTVIWSDTWYEDLTAESKLVFLYLITNEKTNMLGIYEISVKKIAFDTGINRGEIEKILYDFEDANKIRHIGNYIILVNFLKHQKYNPNMKKSAINIYNQLPNELRIKGINLEKMTIENAWQTISKHYGMVRKDEVKVEDEFEVKVEYEFESEDEAIDDGENSLSFSKNNNSDLNTQSEERKKVAPKKEKGRINPESLKPPKPKIQNGVMNPKDYDKLPYLGKAKIIIQRNTGILFSYPDQQNPAIHGIKKLISQKWQLENKHIPTEPEVLGEIDRITKKLSGFHKGNFDMNYFVNYFDRIWSDADNSKKTLSASDKRALESLQRQTIKRI